MATTTFTGASGPYGGVPAAANPQAAQSESIGGNLSSLAQLYALATGTGAASGAGATSNLNTALPGASAALGSGLNLANTEIAGQIDPATWNNIQQMGAERGVATGSPGSPNSNAALMQALGRTTQGTEQLGIQNLGSLISSAPVGPQFNPASMLVDPNTQLEQDQYGNNLAAAPNPAAAGAANLAALNSGRTAAGSTTGTPALPALGSGSTASAGGYGGPVTVTGPAGGSVTPYQSGNLGDIPGSSDGSSNGAQDYLNTFGEQLPPGQTYDPNSGMVSDTVNGTVLDPSTGVTYDAMTGAVIPDTQGMAPAGDGGGFSFDDSASYYE